VRRDLLNIQGRPTPILYKRRKARDIIFSAAASFTLALAGGSYLPVVVNGGSVTIGTASMAAAFQGGVYVPTIINGPAQQDGPVTLSAGFISGSGVYVLTLIDGGAYPHAATLQLGLVGGQYVQTVVPGPPTSDAVGLTLGFEGGAYV
jgi:hypothetical protein